MQEIGDERLAQQAATDSAAFGELYRRYVQRVYRYLLARTHNVQDAQDLTTQTFMAALESIGRYQPRGKFVAWLLGIARHKAADHFRKSHAILPLEDAEHIPSPGPSPDEAVYQSLQLEQVTAIIHRLSPDRAEALALRLFGELSTAEIAEVMGKNIGAVKMLIHRGWNDLRERLVALEKEEL